MPVTRGLATGGLAHADRIGAEAVQVFITNPRGWAPAAGKPEEDNAFREGCSARGMPAFVHAPYLINLASPTPATRTNSVAAVLHSLRRGAEIGAAGVVVHAGSAVGDARREEALRRVREALLPVLDAMPDGAPRLLIEPTAGGGCALAARIADLPEYLANLDHHPLLGVCLDTCHAFAAGEDLGTPAGMRRALTALDRGVGRGRLGLIHANNSRDERGSTRDRHAGIGAGRIGALSFGVLFSHPVSRGVPVVVETGEDTQAADVAALRGLRDAAEAGARRSTRLGIRTAPTTR